MTRPTRLRLEHHLPGTIGIGENQPRISWSFEGATPDCTQSAYELQITWNNEQTESVTVDSSQSNLVSWPWRPLVSRDRGTLRVRVIGGNTISPWSEPVVAESGLLKAEDWACSLIEPEDHVDQRRPVHFSSKFHSGVGVKSARLYVAAHGVYEAHLNGFRVGDQVLAPGWTSYKHRLIYQTFDVTNLILEDGSNNIGITVAEGWFCGRLGFLGGRANIYGDSIGVAATIVLDYHNGTSEAHGTGKDWRWAYGPHVSASLYDGEQYDSTIAVPSDGNWRPVRLSAMLSTVVAPDGPPMRRTERLLPRRVFHSPSGRTIVDFGQNFTGWVCVNHNLKSPCTLTIRHAEVLKNGELETRPLRGAKAVDRLTIHGKHPFSWEPSFTFHGFRYVQVEGWPEAEESLSAAISGVVIGTDMLRTGYFSCSNDQLNQLHQNITWSMRGNFLSIPTDCPQRDERLGWTGDINVFSDTANYLFDTAGMLASWLKDVSAEQRDAKGIVPLTVPNVVHGLELEPHAIWGDVIIMLPWSLYQAFGDENILSRHFPSMTSWLEAIPRSSNGLWDYTSDWKLGDWLDPGAPPDDPGRASTDPSLVADAFLVHVTGLMVEICRILGYQAKKDWFENQHRNARNAFAEQYITPSGRLASDTQTAYTLALHFNLYPLDSHIGTAASRLDWLVRRMSRFKIATGFAGTPFLGLAMTKAGLTNVFYRMLLEKKCPSWLYPVTMGATTVWERWDSMLPNGDINPGEMTSFNHYALGAVGNWMHKTVLGLSPLEPGWSAFAIAPIPGGGLTWAEGSYQSSYGICSLRWEIRGDGAQKVFWMSFVVPPTTLAKVRLPTSEDTETLGGGRYERSAPYLEPDWPPRAIYARFADRDEDDDDIDCKGRKA